MVERRPWLDILAHISIILLGGLALVALPLYVTFVASTQTAQEVASAPMSLLPGPHFFDNYAKALFGDSSGGSSGTPVGRMMYVSLIMALAISIGKIAISLLLAFAVVYFRFTGRMFFFWMIFVTLMLPVCAYLQGRGRPEWTRSRHVRRSIPQREARAQRPLSNTNHTRQGGRGRAVLACTTLVGCHPTGISRTAVLCG